MHFKSALIFCAVYFLTSAWSVGINHDQLEKFNILFGNRKDQIVQFVKESFGLEDFDDFVYDSRNYESSNLLEYLTMLANENMKSSEIIEVNVLTSMELLCYLEEFNEQLRFHKQPGCLIPQMLFDAFNYWNTLNRALNAKLQELIDNGLHEMNAADFLLLILEIKPVGRGLTIAQIEKFGVLYNTHKGLDSINPEASKQVFLDLGIKVEEDLAPLLKQWGHPGNLLMDLILAAAERNIMVDDYEWIVLGPLEIASAIKEFKVHDKNKDGVLTSEEYASFKTEWKKDLGLTKEPTGAIREALDYLKKFDDYETITITEYLGYEMITTLQMINDITSTEQ